mgnify:FL=1
MIYLTSDWHLNHDQPFIWSARGFQNVEEMNAAIVQRHNSIVQDGDDVYVLGDLCMNKDKLEENQQLISSMRGRLHVIVGNHDSDKKTMMYLRCPNVMEIVPATYLKYKKRTLFLSHYPCFTGNVDSKLPVLSTFGHTHQKEIYYNDIPYMINVGVDAHDCYPVSIDDVLKWAGKK